MAKEMALLNETQLKEVCANPNPLLNNPSVGSISESRKTESIPREHPAGGCSTMGASLQPIRGTAAVLRAPTPKPDDGYPSSLRSTSSSCSSYSLEISVSTTTPNNSDKESRPLPLKTPPDSRADQSHMAKPLSSHDRQKPVPLLTKSYGSSGSRPVQEKEHSSDLKLTRCLDKNGMLEIPTMEPSVEKTVLSGSSGDGKVGAQPVSTNQPLEASLTPHNRFRPENPASQEEEEDMFYAFVILHAPEDFKEASRVKSRLESISSTIGATFAEDFEVPGRSTFSCVEDAIENSAYIMLLLTPNFNNRLNETNTDSALMNSIEKVHKYNTVIPLLPRDNGLPRDQMRLVLKIKNPLEETKDRGIFERKVRTLLSSKTIQPQKRMWRMERQIKKQQARQQGLLQERRYRQEFIQGAARVQELEERVQELKMQEQHPPPHNVHQPYPIRGCNERTQSSGHVPLPTPNSMPFYYSGNVRQQPPSNITIQHAKCVIVGNNSTMIVGGDVDSSEEDNLSEM